MNSQIKLHFLGTGTILSGSQRSCSATIIEIPELKILVDIGVGTFRRMAAEGIDVNSIDYIFLTHFHPDHISDLVPFLFAVKNSRKSEDSRTLRVWGPKGFYQFIESMEHGYGHWLKFPEKHVEFYELRRQLYDFSGFRLIWHKVIHSNESVGYRFEIEGKVVVFSGDSGYCQELIRLCKDATVAVLECSHQDEFAVKGHLTPSLAGKIAENASVNKMILNHFYPKVLEVNPVEVAAKYFGGEVVIANDGDRICIDV